jgi:hypothetical protein
MLTNVRTDRQTDRQTDRLEEADGRFSPFGLVPKDDLLHADRI